MNVVRYAKAQRDAIRGNEAGVRRADPDAVHDMRVAIRRLRSTLRTFRGLWNRPRSEAVRGELKWLADRLGQVRDGQVMAAALTDAVRAEPPELVVGPVVARLQQRLAGETLPARDELLETLDGERYHRLLTDVDALLAGDANAGGKWARRKADRAMRRADRLFKRADSDEALHEARKAYKRARYAVEVFGGKPARRLAKRLSKLQDTLGAHHDTVVVRGLLRDHGMRAYAAGENAFTYGLLHARQREMSRRRLRELPARRRAVQRARKRWP